ncbi:MAG: transrane protein, partial [Mycobacterium sp.]|nr:transrane protein [Mycobacterium sp.]
MTARITLALLAIIPAAMAYPWRSTLDWWLLGIAVAVVIVVFAWWRGTFVTTSVRRRVALLRNQDVARHQLVHSETDARTTVVLRVQSEDEVPLSLLAGYLDRYGIRCDTVRLTQRYTRSGRTTWIGLTLSASANLSALQARSQDIPHRETAEVTLRRLADHLRELGHPVTTADVDIPDVIGVESKERWRAVQDGGAGYVTYYSIPADQLDQTLAEIHTAGSTEVWTVVELSGSPARPDVTAACAIRSDEQPAAAP